MSEMQAAKGTYKLAVIDPNVSLEDCCELVCNKLGREKDCDSWEQTLMEWDYEGYLVLNGKLYKQDQVIDIDAYGFSEVEELPDGTIKFFCMWYNGGAGLGEVIESGLDTQ